MWRIQLEHNDCVLLTCVSRTEHIMGSSRMLTSCSKHNLFDVHFSDLCPQIMCSEFNVTITSLSLSLSLSLSPHRLHGNWWVEIKGLRPFSIHTWPLSVLYNVFIYFFITIFPIIVFFKVYPYTYIIIHIIYCIGIIIVSVIHWLYGGSEQNKWYKKYT